MQKLDYTLDPRRLPAWWFGIGDRWSLSKEIVLEDGREGDWNVDDNGFELSQLADMSTWPSTLHFDALATAERLFPAAEKLLESRFPGAKAIVFDHITRAADKEGTLIGKPIPYVHNDYSVDSGKPRIRSLLSQVADPDVLEQVLSDRVAIVNVWCPLAPVERDPLAFVDWKSLRPSDLIVTKVKYGGEEPRTGETTLAYDNAEHRWVYFPKMQPGEAILLKVWDSPTNGPRSRFAIHAAPILIDQDEGFFPTPKAPRQSIEFRCMVLFHPKAKSSLLKEPFVAPHIRRLRQNQASSGFEKLESKVLVEGDPEAWVVASA